MYVNDVLDKLDLGSSVAEFDDLIDRHFVITSVFKRFIAGKVDIVAGDKGAGKTTIYRYLQIHHKNIPELSSVDIVSGFNPSGNPIFRQLITRTPYSEVQYVAFWKIYVLSLVGNRLLKQPRGEVKPNTQKLEALLSRIGLRSKDDSVETIFTRLSRWFHRLMSPVAISPTDFNMSQSGSDPNVGSTWGSEGDQIIDYDESLDLLDSAISENQLTVWVLLDRLDEAFTGYPDTETPALRALFRTYLDLSAFDHIKLKLFVRKDLFNRIMRGGFVNLTHVNARKTEIIWDQEDLFFLLYRRIRTSDEFVASLDLDGRTPEEVFKTIFQDRISRKLLTWDWMLAAIQDGTGFAAPRNLVELVNLAKEEQTRRESRALRVYRTRLPLIERESLDRGLIRLSQTRLEDTLLAEAMPDVAVLIKGFRGTEYEHDDSSIADIFGVTLVQAKEFADVLISIGLLSKSADKYRIPLLYRNGLNVNTAKRASARS